jgi:hydrogenase maturation protease
VIRSVIVIGIGNLLCSDDGLGVHFARHFKDKAPDGVEVIDGGTGSVDLLPFISGRKKAIFVDAMDGGETPGSIFRFSPDEVHLEAPPEISMHDFDLATLLRVAALSGDLPEKVVVIAVQVKNVDLGMELSPEIGQTMERLVDLVMQEIKEG